MGYVLVENGVVVQDGLPTAGTLKNGCTVSGYNLLDESTLKGEGWIPAEESIPNYDPVTQVAVFDSYDVQTDRVIKRYAIQEIPLSESELLAQLQNARMSQLENAVIEAQNAINLLLGV